MQEFLIKSRSLPNLTQPLIEIGRIYKQLNSKEKLTSREE
jgi:hypothetical protein